jgi:DtxR family Mn-dependent transcriptional regulator
MTLTEENYLKAIFHLSTEKQDVSVLDLANSLEIKMPTVNSMVKKLAAKGLLIYEKYRPLSLTESGRLEAGVIIRKHRLVEMFLVEKMGFQWDEVHEIAEQIEHIDSSVFFDRINELLKHPKFDPHGSPIPDQEGRIASTEYLKLNDGQIGKEYIFTSVAISQSSFLKQINKHGLRLGDKLKIIEILSFDKSIVVSINGQSTENLSGMVAGNILVSE